MHPKINKNGHLDLSVSIGCPPGLQDHQNGVPGTPNGASRSPKGAGGRGEALRYINTCTHHGNETECCDAETVFWSNFFGQPS